MKRSLSRAFSVAAVAGLCTAGMLAIASPAHATYDDCTTYLAQYYDVGPKVKAACKNAADHNSGPTKGYFHAECKTALIVIGVTSTRADLACTKAQR